MAREDDEVLGLLEAALAAVPGAQARRGQRTMVTEVARALTDETHLLVQAGTGTGKSLGYLVPALASGQTVVVATATKALQAQLVDVDLPRLVDGLGSRLRHRPRFALAKGRHNYLCLQRVLEPDADDDAVQGELGEEPVSGPLAQQRLDLRAWAERTETGDRDDVPFPAGDRAWRQVSVSAHDCLGTSCPYRDDCFAEQARARAREADVVVTNHAMLAVELASGISVLPDRDAVVVDEAHQFAAAVTDALTMELTRTAVSRAVTAAGPLVGEQAESWLADAQQAADDLLGRLSPGWIEQLPGDALDALQLIETTCDEVGWEISRGGAEADERGDDEEMARRERARMLVRGVGEAASALRTPPAASAIYAVADGSSAARLRVSPLEVGATLGERFFGAATVVATSATLTVAGRFDHVARQLGLPPDSGSWRHVDVGSPFDYRRQGQLYIAHHLPDPGRARAQWEAAVDELVVELIRAAGGRALALFSSTAAVARAGEAARDELDVPILVQGEDASGALRRRFADEPTACLFGTRSFWQGVDVPGSTCQLVIVDRLPFPHPEDPLTKARSARAEAAGRSGFAEVMVPAAAMLLAQGVGRLIRSTSDRGVVAVLDPRLARARYRDTITASLPAFYPTRDLAQVLASLRAIDPARKPPPSRGWAGES